MQIHVPVFVFIMNACDDKCTGFGIMLDICAQTFNLCIVMSILFISSFCHVSLDSMVNSKLTDLFNAKSNISFSSYFLFPIQIVCLCSCPPGTMLYCRQQSSFSDVNRSPACWSKNPYLGSLGLYVDNIIVVSASCHHCC